MDLSYKHTSSWSIIFLYEGCPRQSSRIKNFGSLVVPSGGFRKGVIIQERHVPSGLPVIGHSLLRIKFGVTGESIHVPRQNNSPYVQTVIRYIYENK